MVMRFLSLLIFLSLPLGILSVLADNDALYISSDTASYDGHAIKLKGHVSIDHNLGNTKTHSAELVHLRPDKHLYFQLLKLKGDIDIKFKDRAWLRCHRAEINYLTSEARFYGDPPTSTVIYDDKYEDEAGKLVPITIRCKQMFTKMSQDESQDYHICNIAAFDNVSTNYDDQYIAMADQAIYHRLPDLLILEQEDRYSPGILYLLPYQERGTCKVVSQNGDILEAQSIRIDKNQELLFCDHPIGRLNIPYGLETLALTLRSGAMYWSRSASKLVLRDNVVVDSPLAHITNKEKIEIHQGIIAGKKTWSNVLAEGDSTLLYEDKNQEKHTIKTTGEIFIDQRDLKAMVKRSYEPDSQQVLYFNRLGNIRADTIEINYLINDGDIAPQKIILTGAVRIINDTPFDADSGEQVLQYSLADVVEYDPNTEIMLLKALNNDKVLFYDAINDVQVSADAIECQRTTTQPTIRGLGKVSLTLTKAELEKLKQRFVL